MPLLSPPPAAPLPGIRLVSAAQNLTTGTATIFSMSSVSAVWDGWPAPAVPVTAIPIPFTGLVRIEVFDVDWGDSVTGQGVGSRRLGFRFNGDAGTIRMGQIGPPTITAIQTVQSVTRTYQFSAGQTVEIRGIQDSAQTLSVAIDSVTLQYIRLGGLTFA